MSANRSSPRASSRRNSSLGRCARQKETGLRLGELLVAEGVITRDGPGADACELPGRARLRPSPRADRSGTAQADRRGRGGAAHGAAPLQGAGHLDGGDGRAAVASHDRRSSSDDRLQDPPGARPSPETSRSTPGSTRATTATSMSSSPPSPNRTSRSSSGSGSTKASAADIDQMVEGSPIVNLVNLALLTAVRDKASDIHIEPDRKGTRMRYRIDGLLRELMHPPAGMHAAIISRIKVISKMDIAEKRLPQEGRIRIVAEGRGIDLRVSSMPTLLGEKLVLRILDKENLRIRMEDLGFTHNALSAFQRMLATAVRSGAGHRTDRQRQDDDALLRPRPAAEPPELNVLTVEDPVEYQLDLINQIQVQDAVGMSFARALRSILRQDPDVIMVGEIRDEETARVSGAGRPHRTRRARDAPHERRAWSRRATAGHAHRVLPALERAQRRRRPASRSHELPELHDPLLPNRSGPATGRGRASTQAARTRRAPDACSVTTAASTVVSASTRSWKSRNPSAS